MRRHAVILGVLAPIVFFVSATVVAQGVGQRPGLPLGATQAPKRIIIKGSGNLVSENTRISTPLDPSCVQLVERSGSVELSGVITTSLELDAYYSRALRDACDTPSHIAGMTMHRYENLRATIAGRTGRIRIDATGPFEGDALVPPGTKIRLHWKITGLDGDLRGMEGEGISVGTSTAFPNATPTASMTYDVTLYLSK